MADKISEIGKMDGNKLGVRVCACALKVFVIVLFYFAHKTMRWYKHE